MSEKQTKNTVRDSENESVVYNGFEPLQSLISREIGGVGGSVLDMASVEMTNMLNTVLNANISGTPDFGDKMYGYMVRLMTINQYERDLTLKSLVSGTYTEGNPGGIPLLESIPEYAEKTNDYTHFVRTAEFNELVGVDSTRYREFDLFPDELGIGTFNDKWITTNRNSIITKTKRLFNTGKINSLISRFGTKTDGEPDIDFNGKVGYPDLGMSRGKNLRKAPNSDKYMPNGYNNPYCRVWTHHHQYDAFNKTIRPFQTETTLPLPTTDGNDSVTFSDSKYETINKLHNWNNGKHGHNGVGFNFEEGKDGIWGWKHQNNGWKHSVLAQQDGVVNITPKYEWENSIHTKDCMFSIENLAWKDYNPYEFENALSWEQRGPLGGRIMWFPPYGITFNENTNVSWNESSFIGRGEKVYTYTDTTRSGTLGFMMLTDHPSVTDYASWSENSQQIDDDTWNRFFAGCDNLDSKNEYSIMHFVEPTPKDFIHNQPTSDNITPDPDNIEPQEEMPVEDAPSDNNEEITFFIFYPNNYAGGKKTDSGPDFTMGYLLGGVNTQKASEDSDIDIDISFKNFRQNEYNKGYEIDTPITNKSLDSPTCIVGNAKPWYEMKPDDGYSKDYNKKWWYRIDGWYDVPSVSERCMNQYAQTLKPPQSYSDENCFNLNKSIDNIPVGTNGLINNKDNLYSFVEFAYAVAVKNSFPIQTYLQTKLSENRKNEIEKLQQLVNCEIESLTVIGHANSQGGGENPLNIYLANQRGLTATKWITSLFTNIKESKNDYKIDKVEDVNENTPSAKAFRCAKCTIKFKTDSTSSVNEGEEYGNVDKQRIEGIAQETGRTVEQVTDNMPLTDKQKDDILRENYRKSQEAKAKYRKQEKWNMEVGMVDTNKIRYDNEMFFYKKYAKDHPFQWKTLNEKLQYFSPAFHSMTPEGFNMRLTFLQQCTRAGNSVSMSDPSQKTASNMAFGRPPFCVLRLGDFFNQLIVIRSINIAYDEDGSLMWDLNDEGIGAQPMIARVTIQFDFIGGGDLSGPVRRLQNAMSFNYYANASLYDNRADTMYYEAEENLSTAMGGNKSNSKPEIPIMDSNGNIINEKGTYSVYHSIGMLDDNEK